jgi:P-type Cu+ transporter
MTNNAVVTFDETAVTPERLVEVIRETGYEAELASPDRTAFEEQEAQDRAQEAEFRELRLKAVVSLVFAAIGMVDLDAGDERAARDAHAGHGAPGATRS